MMMPHKHEGGESEYDCRSCQDAFGEHAQKKTLEERVIRLEAEVQRLKKACLSLLRDAAERCGV